ncbi:MAG: DUF5667 domain-containing protein [Patescibacteria group bacterium]
MYFYKYKKLMRNLGQSAVMPVKSQIEGKNRLLREICGSSEWKQAVFYTQPQMGWNWQGVGAIAMVLVVALGGGSLATISRAKASLPGDALYGVKITMEKAQISLAFSQEKQAELEMSFASSRLDEVDKLIVQDGDTGQVATNVSQAMAHFNNSLDSVQKKLNIAKSMPDPKDAKSLAVVVAKAGSDESLVKLQGKIANIEKKIDQITINEATIKEAKVVLGQDVATNIEGLSIIKESGKNLEEKDQNIEDAKKLLDNKELVKFQDILAKVEETKALVQTTQDTINNILDK